MMVVTLGALQSIPRDLEEAAVVDGASWWFRFRHVIWPLLKPALMPAVIIGSVWTFNMFNVIYLVSAGEPDGSSEILISEAYRWAFSRNNRYGYAAAYAVIIFGVLRLYSRGANRIAGRKVLAEASHCTSMGADARGISGDYGPCALPRIMGCEDGRGAGSILCDGAVTHPYLGLLEHFTDVIGTTDDKGRWLFGRQLFNSLFVSGVTAFLGLGVVCDRSVRTLSLDVPWKRPHHQCLFSHPDVPGCRHVDSALHLVGSTAPSR